MSAVLYSIDEARHQRPFNRALAKARAMGYGKIVAIALANEVRARVRGGMAEDDAVRLVVKAKSAPVTPPTRPAA